ncbi:putative phosphoribosyltransferase [Kribbella orskensis]|uniref:Phosphoribosyltransferase n=1 Tax=Kribbella orskensis TaxID=2512216 RepID=A0ABY2B8R5_9ACTN|nr:MULTISPECIES: phosphoribosyltransferase family protein [Kribbella]TCN31176.1 putative phosphoribosyltransferase [Kribbella sp. VKM Ac-2500]TCO11682.1 putative phosphoribosyltransferase [Kribbella orskensis]
MPFIDRTEAGRRLARRLDSLRGEDVVVVGLPRGGVPVAFEVARALAAPLDVIVVRKLGVPHQPELALGAIGEGDVRVINERIRGEARVTSAELSALERSERAELRCRVTRFRAGRDRIPLTGRTALIVDDGVATGSTARAACQVARAQGAARVVIAVPVGAADALTALREDADEVVCLETPAWFASVGQWYRQFPQTSDQEVTELLHRAAQQRPEPAVAAVGGSDPPLCDKDVTVVADRVRLSGHLFVPEEPVGVVVFAHGSGSSRHSPRNRYVASVLNEARLGTLLFDLLTPDEELDRDRVFDIGLLAHRLVDVTSWLSTRPETAGLPIGYFGASTGAAAALWASTDPRADVRSVVSRGGRPDLAGQRLDAVMTPTLLIVGGHDDLVLQLNRRAQAAMPCESELAVVAGATHLFEEPGALQQVAAMARDWFASHLTNAPSSSTS